MHLFEAALGELRKANNKFVERVSVAFTEQSVDCLFCCNSQSSASCSENTPVISDMKVQHKPGLMNDVPFISASGKEAIFHGNKERA